ncbi:MAG TPA: alkaline phosphatase D family protein [Solirubrobacterales bacterium]|nr:alkaline phosphatase D family protein [Solirubrobacterales bacterium]
MADLVLGPLLRYVSETEATVWVEADSPCEVEVLGRREPTFTVEEHFYALVRIEGLEPGSRQEYEVSLDGEKRWPPAGSDLPPSTIRTLAPDHPFDVAFGSCRVALPHTEPYVESKDRNNQRGREYDALRVLAVEMARSEREEWPELLFLLGDQVYVDEGSPRTRARIRRRRGTGTPPGEEVTDFEEYSWLYEESWSDPLVRWLFSTVSTSMLWDDHDMSDDWNISRTWVEEMERKSWWHRRAAAGIMTYWIYQHLGNLSPHELDADDLYREVRGNPHATTALRDFAAGIGTTGAGTRWSYCRDLDRTRAIFVDSRAGRVLDEGKRSIIDDDEWDWIVEHATGDFDHLVIATTVPFLLSPGFHHLQAWNERVCDGAWGKAPARASEKLRRALDFDHWASFDRSFQRLRNLLEEIGAGKRGRAPASIVVLAGDVHHAYLAEMAFRPEAGVQSAVYQAVCSPYRNPLDSHERLAIRAGFTRPFTAAMRALAGAAGASDPGLRWRLAEGPYFDNQVASLRFDGRRATMQLDKTVAGDEDERRLECVFEHRLAG